MASHPPAIPEPTSTEHTPRITRQQSVAVIAVHGVGRHAPGSSAEALATLLSSLGRADGAQRNPEAPLQRPPEYAGFDIRAIDVPVAAVATAKLVQMSAAIEGGRALTTANDRHQTSLFAKVWGVFDERRGFLAERRIESAAPLPASARGAAPPAPPDGSNFDYLYMLSQLADYHGEPDRSFSTFRYESRRPDPHPTAPLVHIYDAHYSDLSKPESTFVGFFFAFYQLLFHLAAMGLKSVYWSEAENAVPGVRGWPWRIFSSLHATAVRMLIMFVPLLNLVMLAIGIAAFADKLSPHAAWTVGLSLAGIIGVAATLLLRRNRASFRRPFFWALIPFLGTLSGITVFALIAKAGNSNIPAVPAEKFLVIVTWLLLAGVAVFLIAKKFSEMRPGALLVGGALYVINACFYLFWFLPESASAAGHQAATAAFFIIQLVFGEMVFCWLLCLTSELLSWPVGELCIAITKAQERKCRARAAHRTGRFAFSISASLFLVATLAIWTGIASYASKKMLVFDGVRECLIEEHSLAKGVLHFVVPDIPGLEARVRYLEGRSAPPTLACTENSGVVVASGQQQDVSHNWSDYLDGLLLTSVTPGLPFMMALILLALLLLLWAFLPSVLCEISPPCTPPSGKKATGSAGEWLSRGLDNTAILIRLLWIAVIPVPLVFGILHFLAFNNHTPARFAWLIDHASKWTLPMIQGTGAILAVSAVTITTLILKYGGAILDTLLDVDNYLRTVPVDETPRAKIAERISSLFRYIAAYRDPDGRPYDRLIIVAHSLGTLVSADLLRFLKISSQTHPDPTLKRDGLHVAPGLPAVPIYLLTMGSPLRPLLNRFFPHLYEWVTTIPDNSSRASELGCAREQPPGPIPADLLPLPSELCVKGWCNTYRSGDYVGRYLWSDGWLTRNTEDDGGKSGAEDIVRINDASTPATRAEMCIGMGAHTHYWDRTAPDVARTLDALINNPSNIFPG
jgi:hypothetical protein